MFALLSAAVLAPEREVVPLLTGFEIALLVLAIIELLVILWDVFLADDPTEQQLEDIRRREEEIREQLQNQEIQNEQLREQLNRMEEMLGKLNRKTEGGK